MSAAPQLALGLGWVRQFLPRVLPPNVVEEKALDGARYIDPIGGLNVIVSGAFDLDGKRWLHVSCSRRDRLPSWEDLRAVKDCYIGKEKLAVQVLPQQSRYINIHPYVLHLWHCVDADPIPDFARGGQSI